MLTKNKPKQKDQEQELPSANASVQAGPSTSAFNPILKKEEDYDSCQSVTHEDILSASSASESDDGSNDTDMSSGSKMLDCQFVYGFLYVVPYSTLCAFKNSVICEHFMMHVMDVVFLLTGPGANLYYS